MANIWIAEYPQNEGSSYGCGTVVLTTRVERLDLFLDPNLHIGRWLSIPALCVGFWRTKDPMTRLGYIVRNHSLSGFREATLNDIPTTNVQHTTLALSSDGGVLRAVQLHTPACFPGYVTSM